MKTGSKYLAPMYALCSSVLFACGAPATKILIQSTNPTMLAGLLYLGMGIGSTFFLFLQGLRKGDKTGLNISKQDLPWLVCAIALGGIVAPTCLMIAMNQANASAVSLTLNFEIVFTALIAGVVFKEHLPKRVIIGLLFILLGALSLCWRPDLSLSWPLLFAIGASLFWSIDNNFTAKIKSLDSIQIAQLKGLVAGTFNLTLALVLGSHLPNIPIVLGAAVTGTISYGGSLCLFIVAMRSLGAARAVAYFSTEPFIGALLSVIILKEPITMSLLLAAVFMGIGVWLHLTEQHSHEHVHTGLTHEHSHLHDEHHKHEHDAGNATAEPHTHVHTHEETTHSHDHFSDSHHLHDH
jgi:drug/metabolite transporter (DMT)-like permease